MTVRNPRKRKAPRAKRGKADAIDAHVGDRVRARRKSLGLSQEKLAAGLSVTFQQLQKYERGSNRISAGRLHQIAVVLKVPESYFFDEMPKELSASSPAVTQRRAKVTAVEELDPMAKHETLEFVRAYYRVSDSRVRKRVFQMVKAIGRSGLEAEE